MAILSFILDFILIGLLIAAIVYALRLSKQLTAMRAQRADMERFVINFNSIVSRAEAGIQGLKQVSRSSGDDLENLIEQAQMMRDELQILTESADKIATRLSEDAARGARSLRPVKAAAQPQKPSPAKRKPQTAGSHAEKELLQALKKSG